VKFWCSSFQCPKSVSEVDSSLKRSLFAFACFANSRSLAAMEGFSLLSRYAKFYSSRTPQNFTSQARWYVGQSGGQPQRSLPNSGPVPSLANGPHQYLQSNSTNYPPDAASTHAGPSVPPFYSTNQQSGNAFVYSLLPEAYPGIPPVISRPPSDPYPPTNNQTGVSFPISPRVKRPRNGDSASAQAVTRKPGNNPFGINGTKKCSRCRKHGHRVCFLILSQVLMYSATSTMKTRRATDVLKLDFRLAISGLPLKNV